MKTLIRNIAMMAFLLIGIIACSDTDQEIPAPVHKSGTVRLTLSGNKMISRATDPGVGDLNENKISNADLFFFEVGKTDRAYIFHTANLTIDAETGEAVVNIPAGALDIEGTMRYDIYAIANASFTEQQLSGKTLNQLKQLPATELEELVQASFVMDGILTNAALMENANSGTIDLERAASKVSLEITVADEVVVGEGETATRYTPILLLEDGKTSAMTISMYKRVKNGLVNGAVTPQYLGTDPRTIGQGESAHVPFYSYPADWSRNDENEAYLSLKIQWHNERTGTTLPYTYRVPVNDDTKNLLRNNHYKIKLDVAILGSLEEETEVVLEPEYAIENWSEEAIETNMKKYQYLWVKDKKVVMNNVEEVEIEYASSSALHFEYTVERYHKGNISTAEKRRAVTSSEKNKVYIEENEQKGVIVVTHRFQDSDDYRHQNYYRPWYITFSVYNEDGLHVDDIEVIQYPAVYIIADFNADYQSDGSTNNGNNNRFVNGSYKGETDGGTNIGGVTDITGGASTATNKNRNQYMISISRLGSDDGSYIIGDPRASTSVAYSDLSGGTGKSLQNYYPTRNTGVNNMIAPAFRIASSWGVTWDISYENAQKRCASYQENGYPAGRWRIPTEAEIKYIVNLSANEYIPELFDGNYWASSQRYYKSSDKEFSPKSEGSIDTNNRAVRCVYDTWYWGDEKIADIYQFTWGNETIN